jgi:hypothetical protein
MNELAAVNQPVQNLLGFIERASKDPTFDVQKFSVLLDRQQELLRQYQLGLFNAAFAEVQSEIDGIVKSGKNPVFKNPYARLEDLDAAARPIYTRHGFTVRYSTDENWKDGWILMRLTLAHEGGHSEITALPGPYDLQPPSQRSNQPARSPIQAIGSSVTYLRRYTLEMALNLVPKNNPLDDNGRRTQREYLDRKDEIKSDTSAEVMMEEMNACASHSDLHVYGQENRPSYDKLFPPDRKRVDEEYKRLMKKFADEEGPSS